MKRILILLLISALSGCDLLLDALVDCLDNDRPQFGADPFPVAVLNEVYSHTITASIKNEPNDDLYSYNISWSGNLPQGLRFVRDNNDRTISLQGTPTELGAFSITLSVNVEPSIVTANSSADFYDDGNDLCKTSHTRTYNLSVIVMPMTTAR